MRSDSGTAAYTPDAVAAAAVAAAASCASIFFNHVRLPANEGSTTWLEALLNYTLRTTKFT